MKETCKLIALMLYITQEENDSIVFILHKHSYARLVWLFCKIVLLSCTEPLGRTSLPPQATAHFVGFHGNLP